MREFRTLIDALAAGALEPGDVVKVDGLETWMGSDGKVCCKAPVLKAECVSPAFSCAWCGKTGEHTPTCRRSARRTMSPEDEALGQWMPLVLEDPWIPDEMKSCIRAWFDSFKSSENDL